MVLPQDDPAKRLLTEANAATRYASFDAVESVNTEVASIPAKVSAAISSDASVIAAATTAVQNLSGGWKALDPNTGFAFGGFDATGSIAVGLTTDGTWRVFKGEGGVASRTKIACFGDSLTRGYTGSTAWDIADSYPSKLAAALPGVEVVNLGFGGNTSDEIRIRSGAMRLMLTPANNTIPASGAVAVTSRQKIGWVDPSGSISFVGYLGGIYGTFTRTTAAGMTFTRAAAGDPVTIAEPTQFRVNQPDYSMHTAIIWTGRNDVSYGVTGSESGVAEHVVAANVEFIEWLKPRVKQFIVVGTTNRVDEPRGTEKYNHVIEINQRLAALYPGRYMDVRSYLVNKAIYDAGLTPTTADLDAIAADTPPPSIMDGGSHYNIPIAPLLVNNLFVPRLLQKGYIA